MGACPEGFEGSPQYVSGEVESRSRCRSSMSHQSEDETGIGRRATVGARYLPADE